MKINWQITNLDKVDSLIASAIRAQGRANTAIQIAAVAILAHAAKHGDYSKASILVDGLQGAFRASLVEWFVKFGGLVVEAGKFAGWSGADHIRANYSTARETAWFEVKKEAPYKGFDLEAEVRGLLDRANKATQRAAKDPSIADKVRVPSELVVRLREVVAAAA
jgi:hypothetical protein